MQVSVEAQKPDRKKKIKRIIAREGLIILSIIGISIILFLISGLIPASSTYIYTCYTGNREYKIELNWYQSTYTNDDKSKIFELLQKLNPKDFPLDKDGYVWMPSDFKVSYPDTKYNLLGHIKNAFYNFGIFILITSYPLYLLIRFIPWAIKTLKEK